MRSILYYWLPVLLWAALVLGASNETFSAEHTNNWLVELVTTVRGHPFSDETLAIANFVIRKLSHLAEYGVFSALAFRAIRRERSGTSWQWSVAAIALSAVLAAIDEWHQTFVPGRTGVATDVLIDICGATIAQLLGRRL